MVQRIDNSDKHYTPSCYTEIQIVGSNKKKLVESFISEFFYDKMILDENLLKKGIAIIKDGANDVKDEICDFSKENPEITFSLKFINKRDRKTREEFHFTNGEAEIISTQKHHKKQFNKGSNHTDASVANVNPPKTSKSNLVKKQFKKKIYPKKEVLPE